jgi:integrase
VKTFTWGGRVYRIWKRHDSKNAPWQFGVQRGQKRTRVSLGTNDTATALTKAKLLLEASQSKQLAEVRAIINPGTAAAAPQYSSIAAMLRVFDSTPLDIGDKHREGILYSLRSFLAQSGQDPADLDAISCAVFSELTAQTYFNARLVKVQSEKNQEEQNRFKRSSNSTWSQMTCLFRPKLLAAYRRAGLLLPDLAPFLAVYEAERFTGINTRYNPPSQAVIRKTMHDWLNIEDRNTFLAVGLMLSCGLRKGEVSQVTWGMFNRSHDGALLDGRGRVKNQSGCFVVPPLDPYWTVLQRRIERRGWRGRPDETVLQGSLTETTDDVFRRLSHWLHGLGWRTQKKAHALRAYSGSLVAMKWGIYRAQNWLRHATVKVTEQAYTHFCNSRLYKPENIRVRFAP